VLDDVGNTWADRQLPYADGEYKEQVKFLTRQPANTFTMQNDHRVDFGEIFPGALQEDVTLSPKEGCPVQHNVEGQLQRTQPFLSLVFQQNVEGQYQKTLEY